MTVVKFTRMEDGDAVDFTLAADLFDASRCVTGHVDAVFDQLKTLLGDPIGYQVDRFEHSLQSASRALRDGRDEPYIVAALLHDIGDTLAPHNHGDIAAGILKPYVGEDVHFIIKNHALFQGYYYWHLDGRDRDRNARERFRGHPHFEATAEFCEKYDQCSFDPNYPTLKLTDFDPIVRRVFAKPADWAC
jgi:predicted HD phosphohydrolase